jgi:hypothetical protein
VVVMMLSQTNLQAETTHWHNFPCADDERLCIDLRKMQICTGIWRNWCRVTELRIV